MFSEDKGMVLNYRNASLIGLGLDIGFLLIHCLMLLLFWHFSVWPMFAFNIFSVILYICLPLLPPDSRKTAWRTGSTGRISSSTKARRAAKTKWSYDIIVNVPKDIIGMAGMAVYKARC